MSKDQGNLDFSVHDPFKTLANSYFYIWHCQDDRQVNWLALKPRAHYKIAELVLKLIVYDKKPHIMINLQKVCPRCFSAYQLKQVWNV